MYLYVYMFGKINIKQDTSNAKNVARLASNFKFVAAPSHRHEESIEKLNATYDEKNKMKLEQHEFCTKHLEITNKCQDDAPNNKM
jgi:hypothetical protein